jgi:hypothetical protein
MATKKVSKVNPENMRPVTTVGPTELERMAMEIKEILDLPDNANLFAISDEVPRRTWKLDLVSLKKVLSNLPQPSTDF